jgi:hypothetical protein
MSNSSKVLSEHFLSDELLAVSPKSETKEKKSTAMASACLSVTNQP